ncbi:hypothetical protein FPRO06_07907 [Fusarium proliferatum]|nr:hypothetical protein FPRO06_07907 [Fusarium proliferatum]CVL11856.1 uncharacterized protein FPRN_08717 [Fusarium proliferatum]
MAPKRLTDLPSEIRQQIFKECLKVDDGYAYNAQTDKLTNADQARTPIDLSLRYTCRSIARDTVTIPLAVNTIYFSTSDDRRSLAGCFNLVATAYYILEQDFVFHLAEFITPEMFAQIDAKFPRFRSMFESDLAIHDICNPVRDRPRSTTELVHRIRPSSCRWVESFFRQNVDNPDVYGPFAYVSFAGIHEQDFMNPSGSLPGDSHDRWQQQSGDVRDALSYCLRLIAKEAPTEFNNQVYKTLPHWIGKYHPQDFLGFKFNLWDIPSREDVAHALDFLNIHDFVWKLPELWAYPDKFYRELGDIPIGPRPEDAERCQYDAEYENPTRLVGHFDYRYRDTIRFSATATAIRFLNRLPVEQRTRIRRITLHEDSPSVNMPSLHARGLVPLYKENPLLQVERRVSVFGCIHSCAGAEKEWMTRDKPRSLYGPTFLLTLESWLIDALSMRDLDIPSGSFIFNLWGGSYGDLCTEVFQRCIHMALAEGPAFDKCCELDLFSSTTNQLSATPDKFFLDPRFREATPTYWWRKLKGWMMWDAVSPDGTITEEVLAAKFPLIYTTYDFVLPPQFEFQTREQYIESRGGRVTGQDS